MQFYKYEPQFILENSTYKLYNDRSITDWTIHNNRADIVILNKIIKEAHLIDVTIPNSHSLHSTINEKCLQYTDLKEGLLRIQQLKIAYIILLVYPWQVLIQTTQSLPCSMYGTADNSKTIHAVQLESFGRTNK